MLICRQEREGKKKQSGKTPKCKQVTGNEATFDSSPLHLQSTLHVRHKRKHSIAAPCAKTRSITQEIMTEPIIFSATTGKKCDLTGAIGQVLFPLSLRGFLVTF